MPMPRIVNKSSKLRKLRFKTGLTQIEVAAQLGVPVAVYRYWEKGKGEPDASRLSLLAKILRTDIASLTDKDK